MSVRALFNHPRFWLFAPFIGLISIALLAFGLWGLAAQRLTDEMTARGLSWQQIATHGFPARISFDLDAPLYRNGDMVWQTERATVTLMPFNRTHAVIDFFGTHNWRTPKGHIRLAHQGNLMSLVGDDNGISRASFEAQYPRLSSTFGAQQTALTAQQMAVHMRREDNQRLDVAVKFNHAQWRQAGGPNTRHPAAGKPVERLEILANLPQSTLMSAPASGDRLRLDRLTVQRGALTLIARGSVRLAASGFIDGKLDLDILNRTALLDLLEAFDLVDAKARQNLSFLFSLGAAFGGDTQDRLSLPLVFKTGRVFLGPLDIAAAPQWRLP
jgi:hypothetical protein